MFKVLQYLLTSTVILVPTSFLFGGLWVRLSPHYDLWVDQVYSLWKPEAAPWVVGGVTGIVSVLALIGFGRDLYSAWRAGAPDRAKKRADAEAAERARTEAITADIKRQEAVEFARWATERLRPWKALLDSVGEGAHFGVGEGPLFAEISTRFRQNRYGGQCLAEERDQDCFMITWLTQKAVAFRAAGVDDLVAADLVAAKIHRFMEQAFRIAGQRKEWRKMQEVPGAETVVVPFYHSQIRDLVSLWGGKNDTTGAFAEFEIWAVSAMEPPRATFVITAHTP